MLSSSVTNNLSFLKDEAFPHILIEFLVAEGLQSVIWTWIEEFIPSINSTVTGPGTISSRQITSDLLYSFINAEASGYVSLDISFASLGRIRDIFGPGSQAQHVLRRAGMHLYRQILLGPTSRPAPSPEMFDNFLSVVPDFTRHDRYFPARLMLHHPTKSDANLAVDFLKEVKTAMSTSSDPEVIRVGSSPFHHTKSRIISLGIDTARHLLECEQYSKARWVMDFLQETYENELGISQKIKQVQAQTSGLELLESLNVADLHKIEALHFAKDV
jgi:hypothetical protein